MFFICKLMFLTSMLTCELVTRSALQYRLGASAAPYFLGKIRKPVVCRAICGSASPVWHWAFSFYPLESL